LGPSVSASSTYIGRCYFGQGRRDQASPITVQRSGGDPFRIEKAGRGKFGRL
jgi:hypothetical protein